MRTILKGDSNRTWVNRLKYIPMDNGTSAWMSLGGEVRYQYFQIKNEDWGDSPADDDGYLLTRLLLHTDFHLNNNVRFFVQLQASNAGGKLLTSPVDENPLDFHQGFAEVKSNVNARHQVSARLGRQEFSYGSQRLIAVREAPNNRQSFDAAKVMITEKNFKADFFYGTYVKAKKGIFDDDYSNGIKLWGLYLVKNEVAGVKNIDLYYIGMKKDHAVFDDGSGLEQRHSAGFRIWAQNSVWRYDVEGVYQFGVIGNKNILAWTLSSNVGYIIRDLRFSPEIGLKAECISGDHLAGDSRIETFNPLFPKGAYFGLAALIGPANLIDLHPSIAFHLHRSVTWTIDYDLFWRYSTTDGVYAPNVFLLYSGNKSAGKWIGGQLASDIEYSPAPNLIVKAEFTWFQSGDFLKDVSAGKDILFGGLTLQVKF
jgi:hypothetical protein